MNCKQLYLFEEYAWEEEIGVDGDGLCEGEESYAGEKAEYWWEESQQAG